MRPGSALSFCAEVLRPPKFESCIPMCTQKQQGQAVSHGLHFWVIESQLVSCCLRFEKKLQGAAGPTSPVSEMCPYKSSSGRTLLTQCSQFHRVCPQECGKLQVIALFVGSWPSSLYLLRLGTKLGLTMFILACLVDLLMPHTASLSQSSPQ